MVGVKSLILISKSLIRSVVHLVWEKVLQENFARLRIIFSSVGSVCQQPNSKSDQSACSGKQYEWFNYKTKDVKIDETKHPQKCFPFETILLLTAE